MENNKPGERKLKIVPKYFTRRWDDAVFPEIRIAGKWLQDLGFTCGKFVTVTQEENKIVIAIIEEVKEVEQEPIKKAAPRRAAKVIPLDEPDKSVPLRTVCEPLQPHRNTEANRCAEGSEGNRFDNIG